jgi:hypothetical protein
LRRTGPFRALIAPRCAVTQPHLLQQVMRQMHGGGGGGNLPGGGGRGSGLSQAAMADMLSQLSAADMAAVQERLRWLPSPALPVPAGVAHPLQPSPAETQQQGVDEVRGRLKPTHPISWFVVFDEG